MNKAYAIKILAGTMVFHSLVSLPPLKADEPKKQETSKIGFDLAALDSTLSRWEALRNEATALDRSGQTIKLRKKMAEIDQVRAEIKNFFPIGGSISAPPACRFERVPRPTTFEFIIDNGPRALRLSCFDGKPKANGYATRVLVFNFRATSDSLQGWPAGAQTTSDDITEIFEAGLRFTGSVRVVAPASVFLADDEKVFQDYIGPVTHISVGVKIIGLQKSD